nr:unnamed protein product [Spirometra erinaceieuropaei]
MRDKATWMHLRSRQWHLMDCVPVRRRDQRGVLVTKAISDAYSPTVSQETTSNELGQRIDNLQVAAAAAGGSTCMENRRWRLQDTVKSTALTVHGRARCEHPDWFGDNDTATSNLLAEKNHLHKAYVTRPTDDKKATFYRIRRLV